MRRPRPTFLSAEWKHLAMLNYEIDPELLLPHVPRGTELDEFAGRSFVSVVGFSFLDTKVFGVLPVPFHRDFEEVNLRFYVRRREGNEIKRGVVFVKEIVPRPALAFTARTLYSENYVSMPMGHRIDEGKEYEYTFGENSIRVATEERTFQADPGSEEEFITEHYWGYTRVSDTTTYEYEVRHPKWDLHPVRDFELRLDTARVYGQKFKSVLDRRPTSVFLAKGSEISVHWPTRI